MKEFTFKPMNFWFLNDELDLTEMKRQIDGFKETGFGGFFYHTRPGIKTPYLSNEWMELVRDCSDYSYDNDMEAWIYDEEFWPSGAAGGFVTCQNPKYRQKQLVMMLSRKRYPKIDECIAIFSCRLGNGMPTDIQKWDGKDIPHGHYYMYFVLRTVSVANPSDYSAAFGGFTYADVLNKDAVAEFIKTSHEHYRKSLPGQLGKKVLGIFTDEPRVLKSNDTIGTYSPKAHDRTHTYFSVPWTDDLPRDFKQEFGFDLLDFLPDLFFESETCNKTRYCFWRTVMNMFLSSYTKQIYDWCDKNEMMYTGHYQFEERLIGQMMCSGAMMPHYEYMHVPGIDHLGDCVSFVRLLQLKQLESVGRQCSKNRLACEAFGVSGYKADFKTFKPIADYLLMHGINLFTLHGGHYSLKGLRKREFPPVFNYQQPWWKEFSGFSEYLEKMGELLSRCRSTAELLVIHPVYDMWCSHTPVNTDKAKLVEEKWQRLILELSKANVQYDLGDDVLLKKHAKIDGNKVYVGDCVYTEVLIPDMENIPLDTLNLLEQFAANGGRVYCLNELPTHTDGILNKSIVNKLNKAELVQNIEKWTKNAIVSGEGIWTTVRADGDKKLIFAANLSDKRSKATINDSGEYSATDAFDQKPIEVANGCFVLEQGQSAILRQNKNDTAISKKIFTHIDNIKITKTANNYAVIDKIEVDNCGEQVYVNAFNASDKPGHFGRSISIKYRFNCDKEPSKIFLADEMPEYFTLTVNGKAICRKESGEPFIDRAFISIDISKYLTAGENVVEYKGVMGLDTEIENLIIFGDFNVSADNGITLKKKRNPTANNVTDEGYPFYAGRMTAECELEINDARKERCIGLDAHCSCANIFINSDYCGTIYLPYQTIDISKKVKEGVNKIEIEIVSTLRNLLGPHHCLSDNPNPSTFEAKNSNTDAFVLKPFGIKSVNIFEVQNNN